MEDSSGSEGFVSADEGLDEDFAAKGTSQQAKQPTESSSPDEMTVGSLVEEETKAESVESTNQVPMDVDKDTPPSVMPTIHNQPETLTNNVNGVCANSPHEGVSSQEEEMPVSDSVDKPSSNVEVDNPVDNVQPVVVQEEASAVAEEREEEKAPIPPPRRKRKKKLMQKPPSLENLIDQPNKSPPMQRSMTLASAELHRDKLKARREEEKASKMEDIGDITPHVSEEALKTTADSEVGGFQTSSTSDKLTNDREQALRDHMSRASRSVTPTPAISIEPDVSLELTADLIGGQDNEIVTSDTHVAKSKGSSDFSSGIVITSDDESVDGDAVFGEEEEFIDGGEGVRGVEGEGVRGGGVEMSDGGGSMSSDQDQKPRPSSGKKSPSSSSGGNHGAAAALSSSPSDNAILESTMIKNLDTGEMIPLSAAEEKIPRGHGWNPLSEHLLRRTNDSYNRPASSMDEDELGEDSQRGKTRKGLLRWKKWGRRRDRQGDRQGDIATPTLDETLPQNIEESLKYKASSHKQGQQEFDTVRLKQDLSGTHLGAVWVMEFSICGRLLATAGQDSVVRVWVLRTAYHFFHELQAQYQRLGVHSSIDSLSEKASLASGSSKSSDEDDSNSSRQPFLETPLCSYYGHTADVLDLTWSKNFFLLSSSMDKTVRLWHISRKECLCCFQHVDFVTAIAFHPRDDRYFLSGSLDGKLRLWNIPDKRVALWNEIEGVGSHLITAANFCMNGNLAVVGTYDGRCIFYETEHLKYHTQIHVRSRHGKNKGRKISGVEPLPGEDKLLVTSNDSRIRLYNLKDHSLSCKYKGCLNTSSQIKATFSRDGLYIISGSEDNFIYIWKTHLDVSKLPSRRDRNDFYECFSTHSAPVTSAVFAPVPGITVDQGLKEVGEMIVAADYQGGIKVYVSGESL